MCICYRDSVGSEVKELEALEVLEAGHRDRVEEVEGQVQLDQVRQIWSGNKFEGLDSIGTWRHFQLRDFSTLAIRFQQGCSF
jgi:hypothetical protein